MQKKIQNKAILEPQETKQENGGICKVCGYVNKNTTGKCFNCQSNL